MCGITGFWMPGGFGPGVASQLTAMTSAITHRGPDDHGAWLDAEAGIALGHRRLSILDLSPEGHQPMRSVSGRYVIVFNGEIYNFAELRAELEAKGCRFRGHSDTEVMLAAFEAWGLVPAVQRMAGMFAFALWDRESRSLYLVRDRFGEKPLYYGWSGGAFFFGSELKALRAHPAMRADIDRDAVAAYARLSYIPAPFTVYQGIAKLLPGHCALVRPDRTVSMTEYWSLAGAIRQARDSMLVGSDDELVSMLENRLSQTIGEEMVADVPLGALLSGGIDSSAVVALMQKQSRRPVLTFSIGFREEGFNEAEHAKAVAAHLGTEHTELYVTPAEARSVIPRLPAIYDEPFADASQIPTFLVSELARRHVTVALSGDGGDEVFGGYERYLRARSVWSALSKVPTSMRAMLGQAIHPLAERTGKLRVTARVLQLRNTMEVYEQLLSFWPEPDDLMVGGKEPAWRRLAAVDAPSELTLIERLMYVDTLNYLPDDILVKVDRASMATSLETRAPLLDHRVVELAWRLPWNARLRGHETKWALRQVAYRHIPRALLDRPKAGFAVPVGDWVRGPLREWARELTDPRRLRNEGFFSPDAVMKLHHAIETGSSPRVSQLWVILMFQAWLEAQPAVRRPAA